MTGNTTKVLNLNCQIGNHVNCKGKSKGTKSDPVNFECVCDCHQFKLKHFVPFEDRPIAELNRLIDNWVKAGESLHPESITLRIINSKCKEVALAIQYRRQNGLD